ncbi:DUF721 domain-containing protein [Sulfitobacter sp. S0837]|uniref:DUF721 domain-containing protein n=1 Tax=Sulfitobacter maritimus TaxID=2741719 RepID=UPI001581FAE5|nr:DciA family protein [Sulfitobacter maritimus]NUH65331.1 DUF721 domain-containing protein [Sulfitobacter maritimus]
MPPRRTSTKGFKRTDSLLSGQIRKASETRGFAQSRLLTHWAEIVGEATAAISRPVEVSYARKEGIGATLTLLTNGANAPMLEMQKEQLRERVNSVYGYSAIARVRITQTAATGFAEGQVAFQHKPKAAKPALDPALKRQAAEAAQPVADEGLRAALARLGENVLNKNQS